MLLKSFLKSLVERNLGEYPTIFGYCVRAMLAAGAGKDGRKAVIVERRIPSRPLTVAATFASGIARSPQNCWSPRQRARQTQPWKLLANYSSYIFGWLVGYSGFLGPIAGVMICDYFVVRKKIILVEDLYKRGSFYEFSSGFNLRAVAALAAGAGVAFVGLVVPSLRGLYDYAWFVGFGASFLVYWAMMKRK